LSRCALPLDTGSQVFLLTPCDVQPAGLSEDLVLVKEALGDVDWPKLRSHLDSIDLSEDALAELCGHIRRYSDWIAKYPRKSPRNQI
jgi:hypothetical protein